MRGLLSLLAIVVCLPALADESRGKGEEVPKRWTAPFGGTFNASFTVASDYSYAGVSNTGRSPVFQMGFDWRSPDLIADAPPVWLYLGAFGSNVWYPATGEGVEIDLSGGIKTRLLERKLRLDLGYLRYNYPGVSPELAYDYGELHFAADYDFGPFGLSGRLRFSPNAFGNSGRSWNKRGFLTVPLSFLKLGDETTLKAYGSIGNLWVERYQQYGLPNPDYWYWQTGFLLHAFGLDFNLAYTGTTIDYEGCGRTNYCAPRAFISVSKVF